jgi:predicted enzyme related to lactoylglutathione lyase
MKVHYLEIVTQDVDGACDAYGAAHGVEFGEADASLGGARTAALAGGGLVGVREPMRDSEEPVVRPYWLVDDIEEAVGHVEEAGGTIALPPMEIPGHGRFAIYQLGGNDHGLWEV